MPSGAIDTISARTVYPAMFGTGPTLGEMGSAASNSVADSPNVPAATEAKAAAETGSKGSTLIWLGVLVVMLVALMFLAQRFGTEGAQFARIKASFYNVIVIALAAVIGINILKAVFTRVKVPGLSSIILAA